MSEFLPMELNALSDPFTLIGKQWMLVAAGNEQRANAMTASWGGLGVMWGKPVAFVVVRPQRFTKQFMDRESCFSLSFFDAEYRETLNYFGTVSGRNEDKIAVAGLHVRFDNGAPFFDEARNVLICRKWFAQPMQESAFLDPALVAQHYPQNDFHTLYIAEIQSALHRP